MLLPLWVLKTLLSFSPKYLIALVTCIVLFSLIHMLLWFNSSLACIFQGGKASLGEILHRYITADQFSPDCLLDYLDLSSEYTTLEIANRIEAAMHVWRQKCEKNLNQSKSGKSSWGGTVKGLVGLTERYQLLSQRAENLLRNLKLNFPGLPQTALDMNKIQYNKVYS